MSDKKKFQLLAPHYLKGKYWEEGDVVTENDFDGKPSAKMVQISGSDDAPDEKIQLEQATVEDLIDAARAIIADDNPENLTKTGLVKKSAMAGHLNKEISNDVYQKWKKL